MTTPRRGLLGRSLFLAGALMVGTLPWADRAEALTLAAPFDDDYTVLDLGSPLDSSVGFNGLLGGIQFLDNDTLLIGGNANVAAGTIFRVGVTRDAGNHITGFSGTPVKHSDAPFIDGGLAFAANGTLLFTGFPTNTLNMIRPGETAPSRTISLTSLGIDSSVGTLQLVPDGFAGAGQLKIASFNGSSWYTVELLEDTDLGEEGLFDIGAVSPEIQIFGGPEGIVYVSDANAEFANDSVLVSEFSFGSVGAYEIDANGDPIPGSRRVFMTGLAGAEGAVIDPLTGDFLFSTFGGGDRVVVVSGFVAPEPPSPPAVAEPTMLMVIGAGLLGLGIVRRRTARP